MEPTLHCARPASGCLANAEDHVVVDTNRRRPRRGDIFVFKTPPKARTRCGVDGVFVKRVLGLPGESWEERGGFVYVDGLKIREPYIRPARRDFQNNPPVELGAHEYFVIGDNRSLSCDSRAWGPLPEADIIGIVTTIVRGGFRIRLR